MKKYEVEELAKKILGNEDLSTFRTKFNINLVDFGKIVEALIPFTNPNRSSLTEVAYQGFVCRKEMAWIVKKEFKE